MAQTLVRDIPDEIFDRFKRKAKLEGKSTEALIRDLIRKEAGPNREELAAEFLRIARANEALRRKNGMPPVDIVALIREGRDNNWRDDESRGRIGSNGLGAGGNGEPGST